MEFFGFKTIDNLPALYHEELDILVISDLHLGLEGAMTREGSYVPQFQLDGLMKDIQSAQEQTDAGRVLVNGDLKHEFSRSRYIEKEEIKKFLGFLDRHFDQTILVKGNHDTMIDKVVEEYDLELVPYHLEDGVLFTHGHRKVSDLDIEDYETLVIGHEHSALALKDDIGVKEKVDCFLYGSNQEGKNIVVLPAFSKISGGTQVNQVPRYKFLSPVLKNEFDVNQLKALAVDREAGLFEFPEVGKIR